MSKTLFEQAIAEAKDVRKTAIENAKLALEESMTSKLQNMFSTKLSEELEEDLDENKEEVNESEDIDENQDENLNEESEDDDSSSDDSDDESEETETEETDDSEPVEAEDSVEDKNVGDLSVEELKQIITDTVQAELASEVSPAEDGTLGDMDDQGLDGDLSGDLGDDSSIPGEEDAIPTSGEIEDDEDVNLEEVFAELEKINSGSSVNEDVKKNVIKKSTNKKTGAPGFKKVKELKEAEKLQEAYKVIKMQSKELKDLNLLNAKLIYVNSIFKSKSLNESQKLAVIAKFDKATTVKEAKLLFEALLDAKVTKTATKKPLKESLSFASKAAGVAGKKPIIDSTVRRFQELAGITKK